MLVAVGLGSALAAVPSALPVLRYAGAAYLVFLAVRILLAVRRRRTSAVAAPPLPQVVVFRQSLLTAVLNRRVTSYR